MKKSTTKKASWLNRSNQPLESKHWFNSITILGLRLYIAPIFILPGWQQLNNFDQTVIYFGDQINLPFPFVLAITVIAVQLLAGIGLIIGFMTRWSALLLSVLILAIILLVQLDNGWHYVIEYNSSIEKIISLIQNNGNYDQIIQQGEIAILANGIELSVLYLLSLLILFNFGGGKISFDYKLWK